MNRDDNFINCKHTFNCALDCMDLISYCLNRQTVTRTFKGKLHPSASFVIFLFINFISKCQRISYNFVNLKY